MFHPTKKQGTITSGFGQRWGKFHAGTDIAAPRGTPVFAAWDGKIIRSTASCGEGFYCDACGNYGGNNIAINHPGGLQTRYLHLQQNYTRPGQQVRQGQLIGTLGNSGCSTGPHLHFEILKNWKHQNPASYLASAHAQAGANSSKWNIGLIFLIYAIYENQ